MQSPNLLLKEECLEGQSKLWFDSYNLQFRQFNYSQIGLVWFQQGGSSGSFHFGNCHFQWSVPQLVCMTELKNLKKCIKWKFTYQSLSPVLRALKLQWKCVRNHLGLIKKRESCLSNFMFITEVLETNLYYNNFFLLNYFFMKPLGTLSLSLKISFELCR